MVFNIVRKYKGEGGVMDVPPDGIYSNGEPCDGWCLSLVFPTGKGTGHLMNQSFCSYCTARLYKEQPEAAFKHLMPAPVPFIVLQCNYCKAVGEHAEIRLFSKFPKLNQLHHDCKNSPYYTAANA